MRTTATAVLALAVVLVALAAGATRAAPGAAGVSAGGGPAPGAQYSGGAARGEGALLEEGTDASRRRVGFLGSVIKSVAKKVVHVAKKVVHVAKKVVHVAKKVVHHVKKAVVHVAKKVVHVAKKVVHHVKKAATKVFHHVKKHVGAVIGVTVAAAKAAFANPPPPPPVTPPPPFRPPPPVVPHEFDAKARLTFQRFGCCLQRKDAVPNKRTVRPQLLDYRDEVLKTIPGLNMALVEGIKTQLSTSPEHTKQLVVMYERRARMLKGEKGEAPNENPGVDYLASPDMLGDIMWDRFCSSGEPCTQDENCLISTLLLLNVLGADGRNASPTVDALQVSPDATEVGPLVGQDDDPNAPNEYYQPEGAAGEGTEDEAKKEATAPNAAGEPKAVAPKAEAPDVNDASAIMASLGVKGGDASAVVASLSGKHKLRARV